MKAIVLLLLIVLMSVIAVLCALALHESFKLLEESANYPLFTVNNTGNIDVGSKLYYWLRSIVLTLLASILMIILSMVLALIVHVSLVECNIADVAKKHVA